MVFVYNTALNAVFLIQCLEAVNATEMRLQSYRESDIGAVMDYHDRKLIVLIVVCLALASTAVWLSQNSNQRERRNSRAEYEHTGAGQQRGMVSETVSSPQRNTDSERDEWYKQEDLKSQRDAAKWAWWALVISGVGIGTTGLGVFLVWQTLSETRRATEAATLAGKAAQASVELSSDTAKRQLRAYLSVKCIDHPTRIHNRIPAICILVSNRGSTPAYDVWAACNIDVGPLSDPMLRDIVTMRENAWIAPGTDLDMTIDMNQGATPEDKWAVKIEDAWLYIYGRVVYCDTFGAPHFITFRFRRQRARQNETPVFMIMCAEGNETDR